MKFPANVTAMDQALSPAPLLPLRLYSLLITTASLNSPVFPADQLAHFHMLSPADLPKNSPVPGTFSIRDVVT